MSRPRTEADFCGAASDLLYGSAIGISGASHPTHRSRRESEMSDTDNKQVTQRGNWGFSLLAVQLILQGFFMVFRSTFGWVEEAQIGLGILAIIAGILIFVGK